VAFIDLQSVNGSDILQIVVDVPAGEARETFKNMSLKVGSIIQIKGQLVRRPENAVTQSVIENGFSEVEMQAQVADINLVINPEKSRSALPWKGLVESGLLTPEFYGEVLRMQEFRRLMLFRESISNVFIEHFKIEGFTEITVPALTSSVAESGAEVFKVLGKGGELALNQSPQQLKQAMAAIYEKVVAKGQFFRDDPSFTAHHLAEFTGLDVEMQIRYENKWQAMGDVMKQLENVVRSMVDEMDNHKQTLKDNDAEVPVIPEEGIPIISFEDAMYLVKNQDPELTSFNRAAEGIVAEAIKVETGSDFYFIINFPADEKPFYTDITGDGGSYSFDLIYRGVEISSGGLRINDPNLLKQRLAEKGFDDLSAYQAYFDIFERGTAPTGGFGLGLERFVANSLGGLNVRLTTLYPKNARTILG
jgi:nondiscriminating aspartyl-tRNA synthetase